MEYGKEKLIDLLLNRLVRDPNEAQASALSPRRYREMVSIYEDYARRRGHAPDI